MNSRLKYLSIFAIISLLIFGFSMMKIVKEANECVANPFVYGAKQMKEQGYPLKCSCDIKDSRLDDFVFDEEDIRPSQKNSNFPLIENIGNVTLPGI